MSRGLLFFCIAALCAMGCGAQEAREHTGGLSSNAAGRALMADMALLGSAADGNGEIPENHEPLSAAAVPAEFRSNYDASTGRYTDPFTGLSALLVKNTGTGEVTVAFAGGELPPPDRLADQCAEASALVAGVLAATEDSKMNITGNNPLGGGLARYAMLENSPPPNSERVDRIRGFGFNMGALREFEAFLAVFQTPSLAEAMGNLQGRGEFSFRHFNSNGDLRELANLIKEINRSFGDEYGTVGYFEDDGFFRYADYGSSAYDSDGVDMDAMYDATLGALARQESLQDEFDRMKNDWGDWDDEDLTGGGTAPGGPWSNNDLVDLENMDGGYPGGAFTPPGKVEELISNSFSATYNGSAIGQLKTMDISGNVILVGEERSGGFAMDVDFGKRAYSSVMSIPDVELWGDVEMRTNGTLDSLTYPAHPGQPGRPGEFSGRNVHGPGMTSSNNAKLVEGWMQGKFYGPEAEGVGGSFQIIEERWAHYLDGRFAGQR